MGTNATIDFNLIKQEKVKALLRSNGLLSVHDLSKIKSFCYNQSDGQHYYKHVKSFFIAADIETVWDAYKTISPQETRKGSMVSFGLMYSRQQNEIMYASDAYRGIEAGQIIFLNLNLFANIVNLAVGHEVSGVDESDKTIRICYLQNGVTTGTQVIQLKSHKNRTEIIHATVYRSRSFFRDKILYPIFHEKGLTEFHGNVKRRIKNLNLKF